MKIILFLDFQQICFRVNAISRLFHERCSEDINYNFMNKMTQDTRSEI